MNKENAPRKKGVFFIMDFKFRHLSPSIYIYLLLSTRQAELAKVE